MVELRKDPDDPFKYSRLGALLAGVYGAAIFPFIILYCNIHFKLSDEATASLLHYMEVLCATPIFAHFYWSNKKGDSDDGTS